MSLRRAGLKQDWAAYRAAQLEGDRDREAVLRAQLNDRYGLRLRDWRAVFDAADLEPLEVAS